MTLRLTRRWHQLKAAGERGDVPGWVLITLMTAMLVTILLAVARTRLVELFNRAMDSVTG